jgi:hypothetical protein
MDSQTGGFVQYQYFLIFIKDTLIQQAKDAITWDGRGLLLADANRRDPYHIADFKAVFRLYTTAIDPYLSFSQNAVDTALWHAFQRFEQEVVNTLTDPILPDLDLTDRTLWILTHPRIIPSRQGNRILSEGWCNSLICGWAAGTRPSSLQGCIHGVLQIRELHQPGSGPYLGMRPL